MLYEVITNIKVSCVAIAGFGDGQGELVAALPEDAVLVIKQGAWPGAVWAVPM